MPKLRIRMVGEVGLMSVGRVVSLFAGCGGSSLGWQQAGFEVVAAVDNDEACAATYRLNWPSADYRLADVRGMSGSDLPACDILEGSPPCQPFSVVGTRKLDDRADLFDEYLRLAAEMRPAVCVAENVAGLAQGHAKGRFRAILAEFAHAGYRVECRNLDAQWLGVPQVRHRLIFVGVRDDTAMAPAFPRPRGPAITASEAVRGVRNDPNELKMLREVGATARAYRAWHLIKWGENQQRIIAKPGKMTGFSGQKVHPHKPAPTVPAFMKHVKVQGLMMWHERRRPTSAELRRWCGFPDDFQFAGGWEVATQQMGNSVPPPMMRAIAETIRDEVLSPGEGEGHAG